MKTPQITIPGQRTAAPAGLTDEVLSAWAYEAHCAACATCRRAETWCERGRLLLAATAPHGDPDIRGFGGV